MRTQISSRKNIGRLISLILTIAMFLFAYRYFSKIVQRVDFHSITIIWPFVAIAALLFVAFYVLLSLHWLYACRWVDLDSRNQQVLAFFASQPYKYLPTSVFTFSFRAIYARKTGLGLKKSSAAQLIENLSMLASNFALFSVLFLLTLKLAYGLLAVALGLIACCVLLIRRKFELKIKGKRLTVSAKRLLKMLTIASLAWIVSGFSLISLNFALGLPVNVLAFLAANTIAFSLSILAFFSPGGVGVREFIYTVSSVSGTTIIFWRLLTFICDIVLGSLAVIVLGLSNNTKAR